MEVLVRNDQALPVNRRSIARAIRQTLSWRGQSPHRPSPETRGKTADAEIGRSGIRHPASVQVSVRLVEPDEMRRLNRQYRAVDRVTDVLAFDLSGGPCPEGCEEILGEVILCPEYAAASAARLGHSLEREMVALAIHGALHLIGYDDEEPGDRARMLARQEELLEHMADVGS